MAALNRQVCPSKPPVTRSCILLPSARSERSLIIACASYCTIINPSHNPITLNTDARNQRQSSAGGSGIGTDRACLAHTLRDPESDTARRPPRHWLTLRRTHIIDSIDTKGAQTQNKSSRPAHHLVPAPR